MSCPAWFVSIVIGFWYCCGDIVRANAQVRKDIVGYLSIVICQIFLTVIYLMYAFVFASLSSHGQTAFVLVLPCLKIAAKNWISYHMSDMHDMKPEYVIFNALYVALCMQSSTSTLTTATLIAVDFVQVWLSLNDMRPLLKDLKILLAKMPVREGEPQRNVIEAVLLVIESDTEISRHAGMRVISRQTESTATAKTTGSQYERQRSSVDSVSSLGDLPATKLFPSAKWRLRQAKVPDRIDLASTKAALTWETDRDTLKPALPNQQQQSTAMAIVKLGLNEQERLDFVQKATKVLFMTEFAVPIEYAEVVTPVIYCIYIVIMFNLPNRAFYAQLVDISESQLARNISNVLLYAVLELLSFLALGMVIKRKLGILATRQLTFVLTTQWCMVQSKFALWVMYVVQTYLYRSGADFSFQFKWLRSTPTKRLTSG